MSFFLKEGRKEGREGGKEVGEGVREGGSEGGRRERFLFPMCPGSRRHDRGRARRQGALS